MSIRKTIAARLQKELERVEADVRAYLRTPGAEERDYYPYKLGALEQGIKAVIRELEQDDKYGRLR